MLTQGQGSYIENVWCCCFFFISYIECDFLITTFHLVEIMSELIYSKPVILVLLCCKICKVNLKSMLLPEDWKYETFEDVLLFPRMWSFIATHIYVEGKLLSTMISRRAFIMVGDLNQISITVTACFLSHLLSLLRRESFFFLILCQLCDSIGTVNIICRFRCIGSRAVFSRMSQ